MQIYKVAPDRVPARRTLRCCGLHGIGLGLGPSGANPYPNGITVSGQGPGGAAFAVDWSPVLLTWIAHSPFGAFPLWTDATFGSIQQQIACEAPFKTMYADYNDGSMSFSDALGYYDQDNLYGGDICRAPLDFFQSQLGKSGNMTLVTGGPPCGTGSQTAAYALDRGTGWYKPVSVRGSNNCPDISMLESFGIAVALGVAVFGSAVLLAPAAAGAGGAGAAAVGTAAETTAAAAATDVAASTIAPEIASFTLPELAAPAVVDLSATVPIDVAGVAASVATPSVIGQVFNIANYIKQIAGVYSTIKTVAQLTGGAAVHPQAGMVTRLPDGSLAIVNADGSTTVSQPNGTLTTIGAGGTIAPGMPSPIQSGFGGIGGVIMGLSVLGYLLTR
jgi:hypothetical protein